MNTFAFGIFESIQNSTMQELRDLTEDISKKSSQLVRRYSDSIQENIRLRSKNKELRHKVELLEAKVKEQSEQMGRLQLLNACREGEKSTRAKLKLNELVREIDHCIQLLEE